MKVLLSTPWPAMRSVRYSPTSSSSAMAAAGVIASDGTRKLRGARVARGNRACVRSGCFAGTARARVAPTVLLRARWATLPRDSTDPLIRLWQDKVKYHPYQTLRQRYAPHRPRHHNVVWCCLPWQCYYDNNVVGHSIPFLHGFVTISILTLCIRCPWEADCEGRRKSSLASK